MRGAIGVPSHRVAVSIFASRLGTAPPVVQAYSAALHQELDQLKHRIAVLEARTPATSETSSRPPSSDSPFRKGRKQRDRTTAGRPGAKLGHPSVHQT
jgi:hypothetical protein